MDENYYFWEIAFKSPKFNNDIELTMKYFFLVNICDSSLWSMWVNVWKEKSSYNQ